MRSIAILLLVVGHAHAEPLGTRLAGGEYYEVGFGGGPTGLVGDGARSASMFGLNLYERHGIIGKAVIGVPIALMMALAPAGHTTYLGSSSVTFIDQTGSVVATGTIYHSIYEESQEDRDRKSHDMDRAIDGIGHLPMTFELSVFHEKMGSQVNGWLAAWLPLGVMPRFGENGPPVVIDFGLSAGQLRLANPQPSSRDFSEFGLALEITVPIVRYLQIDLRQRINFLAGHRGSAGITINLADRIYARAAASIEVNDASRPLGLRFEGGIRF